MSLPAVTEIDFYTHCTDRLMVAVRLCAKALGQGMRVRVLTDGAAMTSAADRMLWTVPATGFLPHCGLADPLAAETPIWVDHALEHQGPAMLLVNLGAVPPPFFARFERLAELVGDTDSELAAGRERYRYYRERGYVLRNHRMAAS